VTVFYRFRFDVSGDVEAHLDELAEIGADVGGRVYRDEDKLWRVWWSMDARRRSEAVQMAASAVNQIGDLRVEAVAATTGTRRKQQ
jgi:hypothetical protein